MFSLFSPFSLRGWPLLLLSSGLILSNGLPVLALGPSITLISLDGTHPGTTIMRVATAPAHAQGLPSKRPGIANQLWFAAALSRYGGLRGRLRAMPLSLLLGAPCITQPRLR